MVDFLRGIMLNVVIHMADFLREIMPNVVIYKDKFFDCIWDTVIMTFWSGAWMFVFGLILGVLLTVTKPGGILQNKIVYQVLDKLINILKPPSFLPLYYNTKCFSIRKMHKNTTEKASAVLWYTFC